MAVRLRSGLGVLALTVVVLGRPDSLMAQGDGGSLAVGVYRSPSSTSEQDQPGLAAELIGRWSLPSGVGFGLGGRAVRYPTAPRLSGFLEIRYAPVPSIGRAVRPILGFRGGAYMEDGGFGNADPTFGLEAGPLLGVGFRAGRGVSLTLAVDLPMVFENNPYFGARRFVPGLQLGVTLH